jgi:hypothetical protein
LLRLFERDVVLRDQGASRASEWLPSGRVPDTWWSRSAASWLILTFVIRDGFGAGEPTPAAKQIGAARHQRT